MDGGGWQEFYNAQKELEHLKSHNRALIANRDKVDAEFAQLIGLLTECRGVLHKLRCYDRGFYERTCFGIIEAIDTHLP